jgi:hypothetical protein
MSPVRVLDFAQGLHDLKSESQGLRSLQRSHFGEGGAETYLALRRRKKK